MIYHYAIVFKTVVCSIRRRLNGVGQICGLPADRVKGWWAMAGALSDFGPLCDTISQERGQSHWIWRTWPGQIGSRSALNTSIAFHWGGPSGHVALVWQLTPSGDHLQLFHGLLNLVFEQGKRWQGVDGDDVVDVGRVGGGGEDGWGTRGDCAGRIVDWVAGPQRPLVARALRLFSAREFCHLKFHYLLRKGAWGVPSLGGAKKKRVQEFSPFPRLTNSVSTSCRTHVTVTFYVHLRQVLTMNKQMNIIKCNERTK